jgi:hypothetical protein
MVFYEGTRIGTNGVTSDKKLSIFLKNWQALEILFTRIGETRMALAFIRVSPIRVNTFFSKQSLGKI